MSDNNAALEPYDDDDDRPRLQAVPDIEEGPAVETASPVLRVAEEPEIDGTSLPLPAAIPESEPAEQSTGRLLPIESVVIAILCDAIYFAAAWKFRPGELLLAASGVVVVICGFCLVAAQMVSIKSRLDAGMPRR